LRLQSFTPHTVKQQRTPILYLIIQRIIARLDGGCHGHGGGGGGGCHGNTTNVTGVLTYEDETFYVDDMQLCLGCGSYLNTTALYDFDGDGVLETNFEEVSGLVGTTVTMGGQVMGCQENHLMVYTINGQEYREDGCGGGGCGSTCKNYWG
jgi:hypothetical protein